MSVCTRKDGTIFVQWSEGGKKRRKYFGHGIKGMAEAVRYNERHTSPVVRVRETEPILEDLANAYLQAKISSMPQTSMNNLLYKLEKIILPLIGDGPVMGLTHQDLDRYVAERSRTVKLTTVHRELSDVRAIINFAVKRRLITHSPMAGYDMPTRDDATVMPLAQAEIEAIVAHSADHLRRAILLSFFCGLRPGAVELLSLKWSAVNWSAMSITIISARKGGVMRREVPIHTGLPLRQWFEADGEDKERHIITWQGKAVKDIKHAFTRAKQRAGVGGRKIPMYAIRHSFVTTLLHMGVDLRTIADISGHDVNTMLKHYAHSMSASRQAAIAQLPEILHPLGAGKTVGTENENEKN
ncbi:MAG: site-specific integrase [Desulfocapsaceae bacterium]|nr:site-specific integrase [Desulfocapsaceae bacterium]